MGNSPFVVMSQFTNDVGSYPRAGHYIIPTSSQSHEFRELCKLCACDIEHCEVRDIGVIKSIDPNTAEPVYDESAWAKEPGLTMFCMELICIS